MKAVQFLKHLTLAALLGAAPLLAAAQTEGEIRKIDREARKITLKHAEIKNLDMPPMTMVFQLAEGAQLGTLKVGDKVRFKAEKGPAGGYVVTELAAAP
jgi:Cu/Ag efflux protein CusF